MVDGWWDLPNTSGDEEIKYCNKGTLTIEKKGSIFLVDKDKKITLMKKIFAEKSPSSMN